ncbi:MAG: adenylate/guanylate cyclase domain-containing protein [Dehalococcoidia bacterium]
MMEPRFAFCTSADGTRIAYATYGSGPPLLHVASEFLSMDARLALPESRAYFDALAARVMLVIFDVRGIGASACDVNDLSLEAEGRDIAAVADAAGLRRFAVFAESAIQTIHVIRDQERVERLILWSPFKTIGARELASMARDNWSYARRLFAGAFFPEGPVSLQRAFSNAMKDSLTPEIMAGYVEWWAGLDTDAALAAVTAPALVLAREQFTALRQGTMRIAGLLPNSQLRFVPGSSGAPYPGHEPVVEAVFEFMGLSEPASSDATPTAMTAILFLDIADSTALTTKVGDTAYRERERALDGELRAAIREAGGSPAEGKVLGDGVMATFASAKDAIDAALNCQSLGEGAGLPLHAGIHAGDVTREGNNVHGGAVQVAARIADASAPNETLVSATVRDLARTSAGVTFEDRGERELKGVSEPVRVFAVRSE